MKSDSSKSEKSLEIRRANDKFENYNQIEIFGAN